ncbi:MAG: hypothetical protein ABSG70_11915 [Terriglobales bacterium]|jgi:hypothetical protein
MTSLNAIYSRPSMRRRYEAWFLRFGLTDGSGAWWFRYLLTNLGLTNLGLTNLGLTSMGRGGCPGVAGAAPAQIWATWFPRDGHPKSFIQEFSLDTLKLGPRSGPFSLDIGTNHIEENACRGAIEPHGQRISWDLNYHSHFRATLSNKGWIGFSRTPHSDAVFSGEVRFGDRVFRGDPLGIGVQGHNCGFRHRNFWTWTHACFPQADGSITTFEALVYEMPLGLVFRKAILWHKGEAHVFRKVRESCRDRGLLRWTLEATSSAGTVEVDADGGGASLHRLPYAKTDCSGSFDVSNNSRARVRLRLDLRNLAGASELATEDGAVLEMTGDY